MSALRIKALKEKREALLSEADAITALAEKEERELTAEDNTRIDEITGEEGEIAEVSAQIERLERIEATRKDIVASRAASVLQGKEPDEGVDSPTGSPQAIKVPAKARRHGTLKAFANTTEGEREAYVAGHVMAATLYKSEASQQWLENHGVRAALSHNDGQNSSVLVPVEMETAIIRLVEEYGVARQYCDIEPMASRTKIVPVRVGGMTAYPVGETTTANEGSNTGTQSEPDYTNIELIARKWKTWLKMSDELNEDALVQLGDNIANEAALAFAYAEDNALFNGDGSSTYHKITGVLNRVRAGSVYTAATGNTAFSTLDLADFEGMAGQLAEYPGINPAWFISKEGYFASMARLQNAAGGNTKTDIAGMPVRTFLGYPVVWSNVLNKTLTAQTQKKVCVLGDLGMGVKFGDRRDMTMSLTDQRYWDEDQIAVKATERFDINVHSRGTATAGDAGALVVLQTPSS